MEFVTFTIKKSLFIIESGQTEHVQLKPSIRREGDLESMWHSLLHLEFPACLPRLFFQIKVNVSLWSKWNILSDIDPDSDLYITSKNAIKL